MDMGRNGSLPQPIDVRDRNMAALALAEAIERVRDGSSTTSSAGKTFRNQKDLRPGPMRKLEELRWKLEPLFAAIPADAEGFDLGFVTETKPKLFVDMLSHVAVDPESGAFRFVQETRNGRRLLLETIDENVLLSRITDHVAERLVARERALEIQEGVPTAQSTSGQDASEARIATLEPSEASVSANPNLAPVSPEVPTAEPAKAAEAVVQQVQTAPVASAVASRNAARAVQFERQNWRRSWLWPVLAFVVGIAAAIAAGYIFILKEMA
jgi:hypothetical protein